MVRAAGGGRPSGGDLPAVASDQLITRAPPVPEELQDSTPAAALWKRTIKILITRKQLTEDHLPLVLSYCDSFDLYLAAKKMIREEGIIAQTDTGIKKHPAVAVRQDALSTLVRVGSLLGLDPTSYRRLMGSSGSGGPEGGNEFESF
ncbi:hypothetical protein KAM481_33000 [Aeromonas caviae]|nr:phage terminase small subunit P27 family [Aeromonas caviae]BDO09038.1 hypothetical protein KAM643c_26110 [Aeromonas caviae]BDS29246.1 hypothetical protein KAM479c_09700 [Aeromonas caviae]GKR79830.1 hypothetical protein KAM481_33000 [Aeromonas caviae]